MNGNFSSSSCSSKLYASYCFSERDIFTVEPDK